MKLSVIKLFTSTEGAQRMTYQRSTLTAIVYVGFLGKKILPTKRIEK